MLGCWRARSSPCSLTFAAPASHACSQCMCGAPFPSDVLGGTVPMQIRYGFEDRYLSKSNALDEDRATSCEQERSHRGLRAVAPERPLRSARTASLRGEGADRASARRDRDVTDRARDRRRRSTGADGAGARSSSGREARLGAVAGFTAPTGSNELKDDTGERVDAHLQPGAGAWSGTGGFTRQRGSPRASSDASVLGRINGTNVHGYHYGNTLLYNTGWASRDASGWQLLLQMNGRSAARAPDRGRHARREHRRHRALSRAGRALAGLAGPRAGRRGADPGVPVALRHPGRATPPRDSRSP